MISGHCLCGQTKFSCDAEPILVGHDHCDDCMRQTGSAYSLVVVGPRDKFKHEGPVHDYTGVKGASGKTKHHLFCHDCGSPIAHWTEAAGEIVAIKAGCLEKDQRRELEAKADTDIYGKDKLNNVPKLKNFNELMP